MKIFVLQDHLRSGGTERHAILLAREFAEAGHDSRLVTFRPGGRLAPTAPPHRSLQPFDTGIDWFVPGLAREVLGASPDIVLCMGKTANCFAGSLQEGARKRGLGCKVVATLRAGGALPSLYLRSVRRAAHLVTNSHEAKARLLNTHGLDDSHVSVIHNSLVFPEAVHTRDDALRRQMGVPENATVLLDVAMFRPEKNQKALIAMAAGLPAQLDWRLWLAGDGPCKRACERLASRLGVADRVRFLGFEKDPGRYYRAADVAVHASREEALCNFLIEAQAHGLPAVACQALGISECFVPGQTGWQVAQDDPAAFRQALVQLLADTRQQREERAQKARAFAKTHFDPRRQVGAYLELFSRLKNLGR